MTDKLKRILLVIITVVITAVIYMNIPFTLSFVSGKSMYPQFDDNDVVLCKRLYTKEQVRENITYGDVVVAKISGSYGPYLIKRVVGLPGDRIRIIEGQLYVNNSLLDLGIVFDDMVQTGDALSNQKEIVIPDNSYFLLGDNRNNSSDSREYGTFDEIKFKVLKKLF